MERPLKLPLACPTGFRLLSLIIWTLLVCFTGWLCLTGVPAFARGDDRYERALHPGPDLRLEGRGEVSEDIELLGRPAPYLSAPRVLDRPVPAVSAAPTTSDDLIPNVMAAGATSKRAVPTVIAAPPVDRPAPSVSAARQNARAQREVDEFRTADAGLKEAAVSLTSHPPEVSTAVPGDAAENGRDLATLGLAAVLFVSLIAVVSFI